MKLVSQGKNDSKLMKLFHFCCFVLKLIKNNSFSFKGGNCLLVD